MKPLSSIEIKLCQAQAKIFEISVDKTQYSSLIFIRRFMYSRVAKSLDDRIYLYQSNSTEDSIDLIDEEFGQSSYGQIKYSKDEMYWIGYVYRCISIKYNLSSKYVYKLLNAKEIVKYYNICHTFDIVEAANRIMESINYKEIPVEIQAYNLMKRLLYTEKLIALIGKYTEVIVDKPIGYQENEIIYTQNYGHIKELKTINGEYQGAYIIGQNSPLDNFFGKVIAVINRKNDNEDKLVICDKNENYSKEEIKNLVNFQEKDFKLKIILGNE